LEFQKNQIDTKETRLGMVQIIGENKPKGTEKQAFFPGFFFDIF